MSAPISQVEPLAAIMRRVGTRVAIALVLLAGLAAGCGSGSKKHAAAASGPAVPWTSEQPAGRARADTGLDTLQRRRPRGRGTGQVRAVPPGRAGARHDPQPRPRAPAASPVARGFTSSRAAARSRRSGAVPAVPSRFPAVVSRAFEPARAAPGRGRGADGHLGQLVRPQASRGSRTCRRARCGSRCRAAAGTSTRTTTPCRRASTRRCRRGSASRPSSPAWSRRGSRGRAPTCAPRCRASRCTPAAGRCSSSGSCSTTRRGRRSASSAARPTSSSSRRAAASRSTELNCAAAHPIRPGGSEAFAIRMKVPKDAPFGVNGLFWGLDALGARAPQLNARVVVEGD